MFSIIICSINPNLLNQLSKNISTTIGKEYEIISFNNLTINWDIAKVYNYCAKKAKYENLIFCHEDILFNTNNWGEKINLLLKNDNIGLVGICGAIYKSSAPAPWVAIPSKYYRSNLKDYNYRGELSEKRYEEVAVIDGCFISCKWDKWNKNKFNEDDVKGFHLYDIDISNKFRNFTNIVTYEISITHLSLGKFDKKWFLESLRYHTLKKKDFPLKTNAISKVESKKLDAFAWRDLFYKIKKNNLSKKYLIKPMLNYFLIKPFSIENLKFLKHFLI